MLKKIILNLIIYLFTLLFIYTSVNKLSEYRQFEAQLKENPFLGKFLIELAWLVPIVELLTVILLIIPRWRLKGLLVSFILMVTFTAYLLIINNVSYYIPCSCGGMLEKLPANEHIVFNIALSIFALTGIFLQKKNIAQ